MTGLYSVTIGEQPYFGNSQTTCQQTQNEQEYVHKASQVLFYKSNKQEINRAQFSNSGSIGSSADINSFHASSVQRNNCKLHECHQVHSTKQS